jgi:hypothetical protein
MSPTVVFVTTHAEGLTALVRMNADGTHARTLVTGNLWSPTCSNDSHFVYYVNTEQPQKIWRINSEGGLPLEVARILGDCIIGTMSLSGDGSLLVYPFSHYSGTSPGRHFAVVGANGLTVKTFDVPTEPFFNTHACSCQLPPACPASERFGPASRLERADHLGTLHLREEVHAPQQGLKPRFRSQGIQGWPHLQIKQRWVLFFVGSLQER